MNFVIFRLFKVALRKLMLLYFVYFLGSVWIFGLQLKGNLSIFFLSFFFFGMVQARIIYF